MEPSSTFRTIFRHHYGQVLHHAQRLGLDRDEATDITQDVFLVLHLAMLNKRVDVATIGAWLSSVTRNMVLKRFAALRRRGMPSPIVGTPLEPVDDDTDRRVIANDGLTLADSLLDDLEPHLREVFIRREIDEATLEAIAATLGRPVTTVARHHKAAREKFDAALARHRAEERRTSGGAASFLVPAVPVTSFFQWLLAWIRKPVALLMSRGGLAATAASVFVVGAAVGALAGNARQPAPCPRVETPAPILAAAPVPVELADMPAPPAPAPTVLAAQPAPAAPTARRPAAVSPEEEVNCLDSVASRLTPPKRDPNEARRLLQHCERLFPQQAFPERFAALRQQIKEALARPSSKT